MTRLLTLAALIGLAACTRPTPPAYKAEIEEWRREREARLKQDTGWLTVAGLFWLHEGENRAGGDPSNDIALPAETARIGVFFLKNGKTAFTAAPGVAVTSAGKPVRSLEMTPDVPGPADIIEIGSLSMFVIRRGDRLGIRLRDTNSRFRKEFRGLRWYPVDESWRVEATWVPYEPPKTIGVLNIIGITEQSACPGYAAFRVKGKEYRLESILEDGEYFYIFKDETAGKETYPAGRFLYSDAPRNGHVVLDFNKAYNPPCAFTPYATCPLPPPQNRLPVPIPAGELNYHSPERKP
jgi:uncharacterized protein (DUF1684 family)